MAIHPAEETTFRSFVIHSKRDRVLTLFGSAKTRNKALETLNHFADWDPRWAEPISSSICGLAVLRKAGAPATSHVVSTNPTLDGRDIPLEEAVEASESHVSASVLICVPGQLALFVDEAAAPRRRLLLRRLVAAHRPHCSKSDWT